MLIGAVLLKNYKYTLIKRIIFKFDDFLILKSKYY